VTARLALAFLFALAAGTALQTARPHRFFGPSTARVEPTVVPDSPRFVAPVDVAALPVPGDMNGWEVTTDRSRAWLLAEGPARAPEGPRLVTLTFDDGPDPDTTHEVLSLLDRHHVRATFFFIGRYLDGQKPRARASRRAAREIAAAGHLIGSHTHDHDLLTTDPHSKVLDQIDDGIASIQRAIGRRPDLFRPPYGQIDEFGEQAITERHLGLVLWSVEAGDMQDPDETKMFSTLVEQLDYAGGGLVLLHDVKWPTVHVLARLLDWLDAKGFTIVDLPTYFHATREHPQPFSSRKELEQTRAAAWRAAHPRK
jgi:peptidoglycan/xylan/chitin deacetylase (PgdA/CDA1 family)